MLSCNRSYACWLLCSIFTREQRKPASQSPYGWKKRSHMDFITANHLRYKEVGKDGPRHGFKETQIISTTRYHHHDGVWQFMNKAKHTLIIWSGNITPRYMPQFSSVTVMSDSLRPHESQHARPPCPSPAPVVHPNPCPSWWCHPAISSSVVPFSSCPQSLPASESFPMSQLFTWGGQSTGVSALASFLPNNTQGWSPLEWTGWISLQSKGLSRVLSNTTVQKHQFFSAQLSLQSNSHIHI